MSSKKRPKKVEAPPPPPLFTPEELAQTEPETTAIQRLMKTGTMPWLTDGPPWIYGVTFQRLQTLGRKHHQATGHEVAFTRRGAECVACNFKVFSS